MEGVVYNSYYVGQNDDLGARARPIYQDGGSKCRKLTTHSDPYTSFTAELGRPKQFHGPSPRLHTWAPPSGR
jgi:hypothetical protein